MGSTVSDERRPFRQPSARLTALENRAVFELGALAAASPALRLLGRGDRHPVLVLPGFTASDASTRPLRWFLRGQGYWVHGWDLGRNLGPTPRIVDGLTTRLAELHARHRRPVSIVGWSLGGIYARHLARAHTPMVRQVITLGSPFMSRLGDRSAASWLWDARQGAFDHDFIARHHSFDPEEPVPVPATSVYSRTDGIVAWQLCREPDGPRRQSIEVRGSHSGLGVNPAVLYVIADRLAQREGTWKPFTAMPGLGYWFPTPAEAA